jgi:hypothetical protein
MIRSSFFVRDVFSMCMDSGGSSSIGGRSRRIGLLQLHDRFWESEKGGQESFLVLSPMRLMVVGFGCCVVRSSQRRVHAMVRHFLWMSALKKCASSNFLQKIFSATEFSIFIHSRMLRVMNSGNDFYRNSSFAKWGSTKIGRAIPKLSLPPR